MTNRHFATNSRLLGNLRAHVNEGQIPSSICRLVNEVNKIESVSRRSLRTIAMRNEIAKLEDLLEYCRIQADLRARGSQVESRT